MLIIQFILFAACQSIINGLQKIGKSLQWVWEMQNKPINAVRDCTLIITDIHHHFYISA
jgi:hypothetical protein